MAMADTKKLSNENLFLSILKGIIVSMLISFALILVFALCLKWFVFDEVWIVPINLLIKAISVVFGSMIAVKGESRGLLKGALFGGVYIVFAFIVFGLLAGSFEIGLSFLLDLVFSVILGGIVGIVKVNKR